MKPIEIHLSDYKKPEFEFEQVYLYFKLDPEKTVINPSPAFIFSSKLRLIFFRKINPLDFNTFGLQGICIFADPIQFN